MPTNLDGVHKFLDAKILFGPAKAANAGGVAMSALEMSQNSGRRAWSNEELKVMLRDLMTGIHSRCAADGGQKDGWTNYVAGANIAGFKKVANAMLAFGVV
jgi:glutamate dehydrogenase (NADP+)